MHFTEEQAVEVKTWVIKRLEDISDADADVLADYVLALIRSDAPDEEIRKVSVENLEDFLKENTVKFVDEIFERYNPKSESAPTASVPPPALPTPAVTVPFNQSGSPSQTAQFITTPAGSSGSPGRGGFQGNAPGFGGRKRSFNDVAQGGAEHDSHHRSYDRPFKTMRGKRGGRGDRLAGGWDSQRPAPTAQLFAPNPQAGFRGMPPTAQPGFPPFDPNDPMAAMLALQSMGFPQLPGMPNLAQVPPLGQNQPGSPPAKVAQRCNNYDTQGFCVLGSTCPYQHGSDHLIAPPKDDEYDPTKSNILTDRPLSANGTNGQSLGLSRGGDRGRGRGRGRGDRGGFSGQRRGRAEFSHAGPNEDQSITTIVVEQIPEDKFNEQTVRDFFSEFGNIAEITMKPYRHLALVKYDDYASAKQAWASPKVIFDNRFVKVYWYKPGRGETNGSTQAEDKPFNQEEFEKQQAEAQKAYEEKMKKRKETEEAMQALEKQKEELLKKQQEEKARLLQRLGMKGATNGEEAPTEKQGEDVSMEPVDSQESEKTKQLRAQLAALEAEAQRLGLDPNAAPDSGQGRGRGWGGYRGRGGFPPRGRGYDPFAARGGYRGRGSFRGRGGVLRLDNRPRRVAISGVEFNTDRDEALRQYLLTIGEYDSIEPNPDRQDSQIVAFKDRYVAEQLIYGTSDIPGVGRVEMTWVANPPITASAQPAVPKKMDGDATMGGDDTELLSMRKDVSHDVDYDVAEVDDTWEVA
ncbi:hypothetical protein D8B26_000459 [Coccidioides posadasii str. Silveira]|uniref:Uncharacterized protein n=1 Tax=Coccidioides posadasii (strain RMSCC 757 / Silveira) TaxID=443226 RepID=E9DFN4_COCPS|nr:conserved hypothetical protein [Coccidioides posadasii str. Silveira]QVM05750.1 hypothetical protein D8B26_000459 [Coccidioides posadasii str. Silveira]